MSEKDIEIVTLSDSKLQLFSPPANVEKSKTVFVPLTPNIVRSPSNSSNPERTNFTFCTRVQYLGSGGFSKVYKYRGDIENKAVKKIIADPKYYSKVLTAEDSIKREVYGMKKINCPHSLKVYGAYQNEEKNIFFILMEQCNGNIEQFIKDRGYPLNFDEILVLLNQLNKAFYLLDKYNIIHRDIKPSNILYKEEKDNNKQIKRLFGGKKLSFKLGDYGVCLPLYKNTFSKSQFMGTLDFMAPEIYKMKTEKEHPVYTKKIDLFSLGQSILCLMGYIKKAETLNEAMVENIKKKCNLLYGKKKENLLADLIFNHLLVFNPEERDDWKTYLNHPIFDQKNNNNFDYNSYDNEIKKDEEKDDKRIKKRIIIRNNIDNNNNINNTKKEILKNNIIDKYSKRMLDFALKKKKNSKVVDKNYDKNKNKSIKDSHITEYNTQKNNKNDKSKINIVLTLKKKHIINKVDNTGQTSPRNNFYENGIKKNNFKSEIMNKKKTLIRKVDVNDKNYWDKSIRHELKRSKSKKDRINYNQINKNLVNSRNRNIILNNFNKNSKVNKLIKTVEQNKTSTIYGKKNDKNVNRSMPFDKDNYQFEKKKTFDYQKFKNIIIKDNNKSYINNKNSVSPNKISKGENISRYKTNMNSKLNENNLYDSKNNNYNYNNKNSNSNLRYSNSSSYSSNIGTMNLFSIRNRYKFFHFLQKQRYRQKDDSDTSYSKGDSIRKQKSMMIKVDEPKKIIKKSNTIKYISNNFSPKLSPKKSEIHNSYKTNINKSNNYNTNYKIINKHNTYIINNNNEIYYNNQNKYDTYYNNINKNDTYYNNNNKHNNYYNNYNNYNNYDTYYDNKNSPNKNHSIYGSNNIINNNNYNNFNTNYNKYNANHILSPRRIILDFKPKYICSLERPEKKKICICGCGCEDNFTNLKFNYSPNYKNFNTHRKFSSSNNNSTFNINYNRFTINEMKNKNNGNRIRNKDDNKSDYYFNIKSIEYKLENNNRKNDIYYSKYSKTKNNK